MLRGIVALVAAVSTTGAAWVQLGQDIDGVAASDFAGGTRGATAMSAGGTVLAVGSPGHGSSDTGHVRVFDLGSGSTDGSWVQRGAAIVGEGAEDNSGAVVALNDAGSIVAIGAMGNLANATCRPDCSYSYQEWGHVRVYNWSSAGQHGAWVQLGQDIDGEAARDGASGMGRAVALAGDGFTVAIGSSFNDHAGQDAGHVRVFDWTGTAWAQRGNSIDGDYPGDWFGAAVSISRDGETVAGHARGNDDGGHFAGHVRVFGWLAGGWVQRGQDIDGEEPNDVLGEGLALSADGLTVAASASQDYATVTLPRIGSVRVYDWNGVDWVQRAESIVGEAEGDRGGKALAISADGNTVAIGASLNDGDSELEGHVRVHDWDPVLGRWVQRGGDLDGENTWDYSGYSVAMSADGNRVASGARYTADAEYFGGHVCVFGWPTAPPPTPSPTLSPTPSTPCVGEEALSRCWAVRRHWGIER